MGPSEGELSDRITNKIEQIRDLELEAARREGVAEEKKKGLEIESVESMRLFRQASGYLLRAVDLRAHFENELDPDNPHVGRVLGHIDDYNQLLKELKDNDTFQTTVQAYEKVEYEAGPDAYVTIGRQRVSIKNEGIYPAEMYPAITDFVAPRMIRQTEKLENALIGRCMSGK